MNKVVNLKFVKDIVKRELVHSYTGELVNDIEVVIKLKNIDNGKSRIHSFSDFLTQYRNNKPKYVSDIADDIVRFLNFIYFGLNAKELSHIKFLTIDIGAKFLEQYSVNKSINSVLKMDRNLTKFYHFLLTKNILVNVKSSDIIAIMKENNRLGLISPFQGKYKSYATFKPKPIHDLDRNLLFLFIDTAQEISPNIALGVYMQIFGGLRVSEIVSLKYSSLSLKGTNGRQGVTANIRKIDLRPDLKSSGISQAKKERKQVILSIPSLFPQIYSNHICNYKCSTTNAVFVTNKGEPMTSDMYRYYFNKTKNSFINRLINSSNITLKTKGFFLKNQKWSTHIGRGIFSNMVSNSSSNIAELATMRGDSNFSSSLPYVTDNKNVEEKIVNIMNEYYNEYLKLFKSK